MGERLRYKLAITSAEVMYNILEAEYKQGERDLDKMMNRLKDLSAYSLTHAEIMSQKEGPELLALAMFFGATSDPRYHKNQRRIGLLTEETISYKGNADSLKK